MTEFETLRRAALSWMEDDPDPETRQELDRLLAQLESKEVASELVDRLERSLQFGTAGLRGLLGAGPNRMNRKVVLRATCGLCRYLLKTVEGAAERGICVGYDGRRRSSDFARDVASVALGLGFKVYAFDHVVPTPLLAFASLANECAGAVMVTASHNPPNYNGYKVYWGNGAQIIPPHDRGIAAEIEAIASLNDIARVAPEDADSRRYVVVPAELENDYLQGVRALQVHPGLPRNVSIAYTALHGVGDRLAQRALADAGFTHVWSVPEQAQPDASFPTVEFPNPEEPGAMDRVLALAREKDAGLVLANDPDADRLAVAVRSGPGEYTQLTGNDVGCLLGHYLLDQGPAGDARLVVNTIVSSPMLGAIAEHHQARWEQTLTGFKWIANRALELEESGTRFVFGFEEALGYTVGQLIRDKDGIGTAVVVADLAAWADSQDRTLLGELENVWRRYGMFLSKQVSDVYPGSEGAKKIATLMDTVRNNPPKTLGGFEVESFLDLSASTRTRNDGTKEALSFPPSNVLALELAQGHRVMLRPSGTEPKIKFYFDVRVTLSDDENPASARERGEATVDALVAALRAILPT